MTSADQKAGLFRTIAVGAFVLMMAWVPFPLGSAVSWGAGLFEMLVAACWVLWILANLAEPGSMVPAPRHLLIPLGLWLVVLLWAFAQILPAPASLANPLWAMASDVMKTPLRSSISLNPWRTDGEIVKLASYMACCWLAWSMARTRSFAMLLFVSLITISVAYAVYGFGLAMAGTSQAQIIYHLTLPRAPLSGPFMLHNSFATYAGLGFLAAVSLFFSLGVSSMVRDQGARRFLFSMGHYMMGRAFFLFLAALILFSAVVGSNSRGGVLAMLGATLVMSAIAMILSRRVSNLWVAAVVLTPLFLLLLLISVQNAELQQRFTEVLDAGTTDGVRLALWQAALRMIQTVPWQGLGLGTFQDAYPLYANQVLPFVLDKAHCDYLELAAGLGLPAAILCWLAMVWLTAVCLLGAFRRRRDRFFALTAVSAVVLVAIHSAVDFSLQLPAVALSFCTLLGIGIAQSRRTKSANREA
jgi:O-antigen ligase